MEVVVDPAARLGLGLTPFPQGETLSALAPRVRALRSTDLDLIERSLDEGPHELGIDRPG